MVFIHVRTFSADVPTLESCSALVSPRVCSALPKALQVDTRYIYGESTDCERSLIKRSPDMLVCWVRTVCLVSWKAMGVWHTTYFHISCIHCIRSAHHLDYIWDIGDIWDPSLPGSDLLWLALETSLLNHEPQGIWRKHGAVMNNVEHPWHSQWHLSHFFCSGGLSDNSGSIGIGCQAHPSIQRQLRPYGAPVAARQPLTVLLCCFQVLTSAQLCQLWWFSNISNENGGKRSCGQNMLNHSERLLVDTCTQITRTDVCAY